jgi:hypothetical protein
VQPAQIHRMGMSTLAHSPALVKWVWLQGSVGAGMRPSGQIQTGPKPGNTDSLRILPLDYPAPKMKYISPQGEYTVPAYKLKFT